MTSKTQETISTITTHPATVVIFCIEKSKIPLISHSLIEILFFTSNPERNDFFFNCTRTRDENEVTFVMDQVTFRLFYNSIFSVCEEFDIKVNSVINSELENWNVFRVQLGSLGYVGSGVISSITSPLSENNIPLFYICTFDTDFVLVKSKHIRHALKFLRQRFEVEVSVDLNEYQSELMNEDLKSSCPVPIKLCSRDYKVLLAGLDKKDKADCMKDLIKFICFPSDFMNFNGIVETADEISLLIDDQYSSNDFFEHFEKLVMTDYWSPLQRRSKSGFDEIGIISHISKPLADHKISVLYISTYNTGFVMVSGESTQHALHYLHEQPNIVVE